jgi:hypothetical protein
LLFIKGKFNVSGWLQSLPSIAIVTPFGQPMLGPEEWCAEYNAMVVKKTVAACTTVANRRAFDSNVALSLTLHDLPVPEHKEQYKYDAVDIRMRLKNVGFLQKRTTFLCILFSIVIAPVGRILVKVDKCCVLLKATPVTRVTVKL